MKNSFKLIAIAGLMAGTANAATTVYSSAPLFTAALGSSFTDSYSAADYGSGAHVYSDAVMSAKVGQTTYNATGFANTNIIGGDGAGTYCAGCNGSFTLGFTQTSYGDASGVYGAGFNVLYNGGYTAFVTFGNGTSANYTLGSSGTYFGISSDLEIKSIALGLVNGGATTSGGFAIDNLTIGSSAGAVPEPASWAMMVGGFGLLGGALRRRRSVNVTFA